MGLLKANEINKIKQKGIYSDGDGLRLRVDKNNNKNWVFRYSMFGKSKDMGLGKFPIVTLSDARQKLVNAKKIIYEGKDPIKLKKEKQIELKRKSITFKKIRELKYECIEVSSFTGFNEILQGRVKTLHPKIHAGILFKRNNINAILIRH